MTSQERQDAYDQRCLQLEAAIGALTPRAQQFVSRWRRLLEMGGRLGPKGCALGLVESFVADVGRLVGDTLVPTQSDKVAGTPYLPDPR